MKTSIYCADVGGVTLEVAIDSGERTELIDFQAEKQMMETNLVLQMMLTSQATMM